MKNILKIFIILAMFTSIGCVCDGSCVDPDETDGADTVETVIDTVLQDSIKTDSLVLDTFKING